METSEERGEGEEEEGISSRVVFSFEFEVNFPNVVSFERRPGYLPIPPPFSLLGIVSACVLVSWECPLLPNNSRRGGSGV
jgi:hypothetical protein